MTFTQQVHNCDDHTVTDPATREAVYTCTTIICLDGSGRVVWESHDDAAIDPATRINPDVPAEDYRASGDPVPITPA